MRELERRVVLSVLDRKWREHLYEMDYLREGIYLRAYSQRDPLVEYQREGFDMFAAMMDGIKEESVGFLFNLEVQVEEDEDGRGGRGADACRHAGGAGPEVDPAAEAEPSASAFEKPRNVDREPQIRAKGLERPKQPQNLSYSAPSRGRRGRGRRRDGQQRRRRVRRDRPQRSSAPAARARSTSGATAPRAGPPASPPASARRTFAG